MATLKQWKIYVILTSVMLIWGVNLAVLKFLVEQIGPVTLTAFRIFVAAISVFVILGAFKMVRLPNRGDWKFILPGALLNVVAHHYFMANGLTLTTGTNAGLILGTGPMLTAVLVSLIMKNFPTRLQWLGVVVGMAGVSITVLAGSGPASGMNLGDAYIFLAILAQVLSYIVIANAAKTFDPRLLTGYMLLIGSVALFLIAIVQEPGEIRAFAGMSNLFWLAFLFSAVIGTCVGHMLYNFSIGQAGPAKAAIFMNLNTLFSLLAVNVLLGEVITLVHIGGFVLIVIGVVFGSGAAEDLMNKRRKRLSA